MESHGFDEQEPRRVDRTVDAMEDDSSLGGIGGFGYQIDCKWRNLVSRFFVACKLLAASIEASAHPYFIVPVIIARDVTCEALEELPNLYKSYRVKCGFADGQIFIYELSSSGPHARAVNSVVHQANMWNRDNQSRFAVTSDCCAGLHGDSTAPDLIVQVGNYVAPHQRDERLILMEVEASNSTVTHLRERSAQYYQLQPLLYSVVAIKLFGGGDYPCHRAVAVQWVRVNGAIIVRGQWDIGTRPITAQAIKAFAEDAGPHVLPPVPAAAWATSRYPPVTALQVPSSPGNEGAYKAAVRQYLHDLDIHEIDQLYPAAVPVITFAAAEMSTAFQVVVPRGRPQPPPLTDFTLDVRQVFYEVGHWT